MDMLMQPSSYEETPLSPRSVWSVLLTLLLCIFSGPHLNDNPGTSQPGRNASIVSVDYRLIPQYAEHSATILDSQKIVLQEKNKTRYESLPDSLFTLPEVPAPQFAAPRNAVSLHLQNLLLLPRIHLRGMLPPPLAPPLAV